MKNKFLHYILSLSLVFSPTGGFSQSTGEIRNQSNDLEFYDGTTWTSMNVADSTESCSEAGEIRYNTTPNPDRMEFCDGSTWRQMDHEVTTDACTEAGEIEWNNAYLVPRYCNGSFWVKVAAGTDTTGTIFITSGTTWQVPNDWDNSNNTIEVIGGGGGGGNGTTTYSGSGGGGGAYSKITNATLTPGSTVTIAVGTGGANAGGDTYVCNSTSNCADINGSAVIVGAKGGARGTNNGGTGAAGGAAASGVGDVKTSGGAGGAAKSSGTYSGAGGGGGAGGPSGNGANAGRGSTTDCYGSGGGGGANGGSAGSNGGSTDVNERSIGGNGGNGPGGTGGGTGNRTSAGGAGSNGGGGGGGGGSCDTENGYAGGAGGASVVWTQTSDSATAGPGGGGGGGGTDESGTPDSLGGAGGGYGGGGGGGGGNFFGTAAGGAGAPGIIIITYPMGPDATPDTFDFPDVYGAALSTVYSVAAQVTGFAVNPTTATVSGGDAEIRKNSTGVWGSSVDVSPGDILNLRMTSSGSASTGITATVSIGNLNVDWLVTTAAGAEHRYFVLTSSAVANGNLGGLSGANDTCLTDLQNNDWLGKSNVTLDSSNVKAFLCDGTTCNNAAASKTYAFAQSGSSTGGGATFTTDANGRGPGDSTGWNTATYFGTTTRNYWMGRASNSASLWETTSESNHCSGWTSASSGVTGRRGTSNSTSATRWRHGTAAACNTTTYRLICLVDYVQGSDTVPDTFDFTDVTSADLNTEYEASALMSGFTGPVTASATNGAEIRVNNTGSWVTSGLSVNPGDTLNVRMTSSASEATTVSTTVTVGTGTANWSITTYSNFPQVMGTAGTSGPLYTSPHDVNLPAGIQNGDLLIMIMTVHDESTITTPTGWTNLYNLTQAGAIGLRSAAYYRVADGSEGSDFEVTLSDDSDGSYLVYRITNYQGTPEVATSTAAADTVVDPPSLSPSWGSSNTLWLAVYGSEAGDSGVASWPTNYTNGVEAPDTWHRTVGAQRELNTATENPGTFTKDSGAFVTATIAVRPPACTSAWVPRDSNRDWMSVASSADGTKLVATVYGGQIYTSTDSGATWTARDSNRNWGAVTSSADGTKLAAIVEGGQIYTSTDSGATWTARDSNRDWVGITSSADGTKLVASVFWGNIYTSTDSGVNWTSRASTLGWVVPGSSSDGTKIVMPAMEEKIYTSTDSGVNWTGQSVSHIDWYAAASSSDGTKLAAVAYNDKIYTSTDSGVNWTARDSDRNWTSIASSSDGSRLVAGVEGGYLYYSSDSGATWTQTGISGNWSGIAGSSDLSKVIAVDHGGQIYVNECLFP